MPNVTERDKTLLLAALGLPEARDRVVALLNEAGDSSWAEPAASFASLPLTGNITGDIRQALDTGAAYRWNGAAWVAWSSGGADASSIARDGSRPPTTDQPWGGFKITGLGTPTLAADAATKTYVDTADGGFIKRDGTASPTANQPFGGFSIIGASFWDSVQIATPTAPAAGSDRLYFKSDNELYRETSGAVERVIGFRTPTASSTVVNALTASLTGIQNVIVSDGSTVLPISSGIQNTIMGNNAGTNITTGSVNVCIGVGARGPTTGSNNIAIGGTSAAMTSASLNVVIGAVAGNALTTGSQNVFVGTQAGFNSSTSSNVTAIGYQAGALNTGSSNTFLGASSGFSTTGSSNTFIGVSSGSSNAGGASNVFAGVNAGSRNTSGNSNIMIGNLAAGGTTGASNIMVGSNNSSGTTLNNNTCMGAGTNAGNLTTGANNIVLGSNNRGPTTGNQNTLIGSVGATLSSGADNTCVGYTSGVQLTTASNNTFIGSAAGARTSTGTPNIYIGQGNQGGTTGGSNVMIGTVSNAATTLASNTVIGAGAGNALTTGSSNICLGAGADTTTASATNEMGVGSGANSVSIGYFGQGGVPSATPAGFTYSSTSASGTDIAGGAVNYTSGRSTGSGAGGSINFQTSPAGGSGTTLNALVTGGSLNSAGVWAHGVSGGTATHLNNGNLSFTTAGNGILIKEGSNARMGVSTLVGGTVTVSNTSITANTRIFLTKQSSGTPVALGALSESARVAATSFTITSDNVTDTSNVAWLLIEST